MDKLNQTVYIKHTDLEKVKRIWGYHEELIQSLKFRNWDLLKSQLMFSDYLQLNTNLAAVRQNDNVYIISPNRMILDSEAIFNSCNIKSVDFTNIDLSQITDFDNFFRGCGYLEKVEFGDSLPSRITSITLMFKGCDSIKSIDLSKFDLSYCTRIGYAFSGCMELEYLNLGNLPANVLLLNSYIEVFRDCRHLRLENIKSSVASQSELLELFRRGQGRH